MDRLSAEASKTYARWFACLADATRIRILHLLASERRAMRVGEIVGRVDVVQSTVSQHLRRLEETGFVLVDHRGTASWYRINERCIDGFPTAADVIMGRVGNPDEPKEPRAPWMAGQQEG